MILQEKNMKKKQPEAGFIALLITAVTAITLAATDIYLPATLAIAEEFHTTSEMVQRTIFLYFMIFAAGQLIMGPLSDHYGRRKVLLVSQFFFFSTTLLAALAASINGLIVLRMLQALGACAGNVLARAIIGDLFDKKQAIKMMTLMGMAMAIAPALAPLTGYAMFVLAGWRSIFVFLGIVAAALFVLIVLRLPETASVDDSQKMDLRQLISNYYSLLISKRYLRYALSTSLLNSGLFAIIVSSPFVFMEQYGIDKGIYSLVYSGHVLMFVTGAGIASMLSKKWEADRVIALGLSFAALNGGYLLILGFTAKPPLIPLIAGTVIFSIFLGFVFPSANMSAVMTHPKIAGTASAMLSFLLYGAGSVVGMVIATLGQESSSAMPMVLTIAVVSMLSCLLFFILSNCGQEQLGGSAALR